MKRMPGPDRKGGGEIKMKDEKTEILNTKEKQDFFSPINRALLCSGPGLIPTS